MKTFITTLIATLLMCISSTAQVSLPYYSGFDNTTQQDGWTEYKKAATTFSHWGYAGANAFSDPNCIAHDYSPSTGITLTDNWYVSPGFSIANGGTLDSLRYMFSGFSVPEEGDTVAVYLLHGSQDPDLASSKILLFDFRGSDYVADFTYRLLEGISLPAFDGMSYIAIRYRNTDCSSQWLTVHFDNVAVNGSTTGFDDAIENVNPIKIYPNPAIDHLTIEAEQPLGNLTITDVRGRVVLEKRVSDSQTTLDIHRLVPGVYTLRGDQNSHGASTFMVK